MADQGYDAEDFDDGWDDDDGSDFDFADGDHGGSSDFRDADATGETISAEQLQAWA
jgi:hypothetical protein